MKPLEKVAKTVFALVCGSAISLSLMSCGAKDTLPEFVKDEMKLVWSDEFDGLSDEPNPEVWDYKEGAHGWGNNELQNYTKNRENSYVTNGTLKIEAKKNEKGKWTSARLFSQYKKSVAYGYIEVRAKVPVDKGCWPAIWMLPESNAYGIWPRSGEIDIMEASANVWGNKVYGTAHCLAGHGGNPIISVGKEMKKIDKKWHTYAVNWTPEGITWYYDGQVLTDYRNPHNAEDDWMAWPFDQPFHFIFNVAMGGNLGGDIDKKLEKCVMEIDYVRVYE